MEQSKDIVEPRCAYARQCGGCQIQALSYEKQLAYKQQKIANNLIRIGGFQKEEIPMQPIIGMEDPYHYRNKAQFPVGCDKEGHLIAGFYAGRTHSIISNRKCYLGVEVNEQILNLVLAHMEAHDIPAYDETTGKGLVRHVLIRYGFQSKEIMVCLVVNGSRIPGAEDLIAKLREIPGMTSISLNINREKTNVILGRKGKLLWGQEYITDTIGPIAYQISPQSFYQVNPVQTQKLYEKALEYAGLEGNETVHALRGVSFAIQPGEFVTIMGTSGSGKSTLLNVLGCLDTPTAGEYWLDGYSVRQMGKNERASFRNLKIGFIFQSYNLLPKTTAFENVELPLL